MEKKYFEKMVSSWKKVDVCHQEVKIAQPQPAKLNLHSQGHWLHELQENFWVKHRLKKMEVEKSCLRWRKVRKKKKG